MLRKVHIPFGSHMLIGNYFPVHIGMNKLIGFIETKSYLKLDIIILTQQFVFSNLCEDLNCLTFAIRTFCRRFQILKKNTLIYSSDISQAIIALEYCYAESEDSEFFQRNSFVTRDRLILKSSTKNSLVWPSFSNSLRFQYVRKLHGGLFEFCAHFRNGDDELCASKYTFRRKFM